MKTINQITIRIDEIEKRTPVCVPVFTRSLYLALDVYYSLLLALGYYNSTPAIHTSAAIFWAFELYYSGFEENTIHLLKKLSKDITNPTSVKIMNRLFREWTDNREMDAPLLASIVYNLACFTKQIVEPPGAAEALPPKLVRIPYKNIAAFTGTEPITTIYESDKTFFDEELGVVRKEVLESIRDGTWVYRLQYTPVWNRRIQQYGGTMDGRGEIEFLDKTNEDAFFRDYGYAAFSEPDAIKWLVCEDDAGVGDPDIDGLVSKMTTLNI